MSSEVKSDDSSVTDNSELEQIQIINAYQKTPVDVLVKDWWFEHDHLLIEFPSGKIDCFGSHAFIAKGD